MKKHTNKTIYLFVSFSIIAVILCVFLLTGCIGSKPSKYVVGKVNNDDVTKESIYGISGNEINNARKNMIVVKGQGISKVIADMVMIDIAVMTEKPSSADSVSENSKSTQNVITAIKTLDNNNIQIESRGFNLQPLYNYIENKPPVIYAYRTITSLLVKTSKIEKIGDIISVAIEAGANDVSSIAYDLSDESKKKAKSDTLALAIKDANLKADAVASAMAVDIVEIYSVNETGTSYPSPIYRILKEEAEAALDTTGVEMVTPPSLIPQEIEVKAEIEVTYFFK